MKENKVRPNPTPSAVPFNDPRYPIWGRVFLCKVPRIAHYSTLYLETYGLHTSDNKNVDLEQVKKATSAYITVNAMIEYYHQNQIVTIVKPADVKTVYEICQDYTFKYADKLNRSVFQHNTPMEDLIKIDEFAEAVYQYAGHMYGKEFARSFLPDSAMKGVVDLNALFDAVDKKARERGKKDIHLHTHYDIMSGRNKANEPMVVESDIDREPLPERPSMRDLFVSYIGNKGG